MMKMMMMMMEIMMMMVMTMMMMMMMMMLEPGTCTASCTTPESAKMVRWWGGPWCLDGWWDENKRGFILSKW